MSQSLLDQACLPLPICLSSSLSCSISFSLCVSVSCALALSLSLLCSHCHKVSLIRVSCWQSRTRVFVVSLYLPCLESCLCPERMSFALQSWQLRASLSQQPSRCPPPNPYPAYDHQHQLFFHPRRQFIAWFPHAEAAPAAETGRHQGRRSVTCQCSFSHPRF